MSKEVISNCPILNKIFTINEIPFSIRIKIIQTGLTIDSNVDRWKDSVAWIWFEILQKDIQKYKNAKSKKQNNQPGKPNNNNNDKENGK